MAGADAPLIAYSESGKPPSLLTLSTGPAAAAGGSRDRGECYAGKLWLPQLRGGMPSCCCVALRESWALRAAAVGEVWALVGADSGANQRGNFINYLSAASPCVFVRAFAPEATHGPFPVHIRVEFPTGGPTRVAAPPAPAMAEDGSRADAVPAGGAGSRPAGRSRQSVDTALLALSTGQPVDVPGVISALSEGIPAPGSSLELGLQEIESRASALRRIRHSSVPLLADVAPAACPRLRSACDALYRAHLRTHDALLGRSSGSPGSGAGPTAREPLSLSQQRRLQRVSALVDSFLAIAAHESARARHDPVHEAPSTPAPAASGGHARPRHAWADGSEGSASNGGAANGGGDASHSRHVDRNNAHGGSGGSANGASSGSVSAGGACTMSGPTAAWAAPDPLLAPLAAAGAVKGGDGAVPPSPSPTLLVQREVDALGGVSGADVGEAVDALKRAVRRVAMKQMEEPKPRKRRDGSGRLENPMAALDATERMLAVLVYMVDRALGFVAAWQRQHPAAWQEAGGASAAAPLYTIVDNFVCHVQQHYLDSIITHDAHLVSLRRDYQRRVSKLCTKVREVLAG